MVCGKRAVVAALCLGMGMVGCKRPEPIGGRLEVEPGVSLSMTNIQGRRVSVESGSAVVTFKTKPLLLARNNAVLQVGANDFNFTIPRRGYSKSENGSYRVDAPGIRGSVVPTVLGAQSWNGTNSCILYYTTTPMFGTDSNGNTTVSYVQTPVYGSEPVQYTTYDIRDSVRAAILGPSGKVLAVFSGDGSIRQETKITQYLGSCQ